MSNPLTGNGKSASGQLIENQRVAPRGALAGGSTTPPAFGLAGDRRRLDPPGGGRRAKTASPRREAMQLFGRPEAEE